MDKKRYIDLDPSFIANPITGDLSVRTDDRAIRSSVKNLIMTSIYEKPFHSEISSPVKDMLFQNIDSNFNIITREAISRLINDYEPRVELLDVVVNSSPDNNYVYITTSFLIKNTIKKLEVDVTIERTR